VTQRSEELSQMVLLPKQFDRLARFSADIGDKALGIAQTGCVIHVDTGSILFDINAKGETIPDTIRKKGSPLA
jgi:hypothetical protein